MNSAGQTVPLAESAAPPQSVSASKGTLWAGRIIIGLTVLFLLFDSIIKFTNAALVVEANARLGIPRHLIVLIGVLELICGVVYLIPKSSLLGAILLTGFLGGATAIKARIGDSVFFPIGFGVFVWLGLYLRDERLRSIIPLRNQSASTHADKD